MINGEGSTESSINATVSNLDRKITRLAELQAELSGRLSDVCIGKEVVSETGKEPDKARCKLDQELRGICMRVQQIISASEVCLGGVQL